VQQLPQEGQGIVHRRRKGFPRDILYA
jgi:hypothetical protein